MSLRGRLTLLGAVFLVVAVLASASGAVLITRERTRAGGTTPCRGPIVAADLNRSLVTQAASIRAYFLDADAASLQTYSDARQSSTDIAARLAGLATGHPLAEDVERVSHDASRGARLRSIR